MLVMIALCLVAALMLRVVISQASIMHLLDDTTLSELVPKTAPRGKAKGQPKGKAKGQPHAKQDTWHNVLDQISEDQQSEMCRDALVKEKTVREGAERRARAAEQRAQEADAKDREGERAMGGESAPYRDVAKRWGNLAQWHGRAEGTRPKVLMFRA